MSRDTIALVESPAQFLHLLEWAHAEQAGDRTKAVVLAPSEATSVAQLREMATFAEAEQISVEWYEPRTSSMARLRTFRQVGRLVAQAHRLVIGDPFSGMIQALLLSAHPREAVLVDDGTATLEFVSQLVSGESLRRWDAPASMLEVARAPLARHARKFFTDHRVQLFTVMPVAGLPPSQVRHHTYDWTRRRFGPPRTIPGVDVVGSSLAESGVVRVDTYVEAIAQLAEQSGRQGRYFAHRKESAEKLRQVAEASGLEVVRPAVPLEIELRRGPVAQKLASFPSSVGYTLPLVMAGVDTVLELQPVPVGMLAPRVGPTARRFLDRVSEDIRRAGEESSVPMLGLSATA
jgi:hypothetical protein